MLLTSRCDGRTTQGFQEPDRGSFPFFADFTYGTHTTGTPVFTRAVRDELNSRRKELPGKPEQRAALADPTGVRVVKIKVGFENPVLWSDLFGNCNSEIVRV